MSVELYFALRRQLKQARARGADRDELDDLADRQFDVFDDLSIEDQQRVERRLNVLLAQEQGHARQTRSIYAVEVMTIDMPSLQTETPDFGIVPMDLVVAQEKADRLWRLM